MHTEQQEEESMHSHDANAKPHKNRIGEERLYRVKTLRISEVIPLLAPTGLNITIGTLVIVPTPYGRDLAVVLGQIKRNREESLPQGEETPNHRIVRLATENDQIAYRDNRHKEEEALAVCREKITHHHLNMHPLLAYFLPCDPRMVLFFFSKKRIDFRALVKDLITHFGIRIELRQVGSRDTTRFLGGVGACGREFCCRSLRTAIHPVSISMARDQCLSLNSSKISGACGHLLCCLAYEHESYSPRGTIHPCGAATCPSSRTAKKKTR